MRRVSSSNQRLWVISTLLIALFVRALIPAGFMPATDRPFSFQICPDGFPAALLQDEAEHQASHHHHVDGMLMGAHDHSGPAHNHSSVSAEHCVFAAAAGVFALAWAATFSAPAATITAPDVAYLPPSFESLRFRLSQPRGPPARS
jgi:hypothetical protein